MKKNAKRRQFSIVSCIRGVLSKLLAKHGVSISISDVKHTSMTRNFRAARPSETEYRVSGVDDIGSTGGDTDEEICPLLDKL